MNGNDPNIKVYTADALAEMRRRGEDQTDWARFDGITDEELERLIADDPDERDMVVDWSKAVMVQPQSKTPMQPAG